MPTFLLSFNYVTLLHITSYSPTMVYCMYMCVCLCVHVCVYECVCATQHTAVSGLSLAPFVRIVLSDSIFKLVSAGLAVYSCRLQLGLLQCCGPHLNPVICQDRNSRGHQKTQAQHRQDSHRGNSMTLCVEKRRLCFLYLSVSFHWLPAPSGQLWLWS